MFTDYEILRNQMTRRKLLSLLAGLPLVGRFVPKPAAQERYIYSRWVSADGVASEWRGIRIGIDITVQEYLDANAQFGPFPIYTGPDGIWELRPNGPKRISENFDK